MDHFPNFTLKSAWILLILVLLVWIPVLNEHLWVIPTLVSYKMGIAEGPSGSARFGYMSRYGITAPIVEVPNGCNIDPEHPPECTGSIVLVRQGNCTNRGLVSMYELLGAKGVLIVSKELVDESTMFSMSRDTVNIPSVRIGRVVAEQVRAKGTAQFVPVLDYGPSLAVSIIFSVLIIMFMVGMWGGYGSQGQAQEYKSIPGSPKARWKKRVKADYAKQFEA